MIAEPRRTATHRWGAGAGIAYVVLYLAAFALGIEVGPSDREILEYYEDSGHQSKELVAFFLIAAAALAMALFANAVRGLIARAEPEPRTLAALAWAGGIGCAVLTLAGNAISRAPALAAMGAHEDFELLPNARRLLETAGFLLFVSAVLAAILLVVALSLAVLRYRLLPRWLGWAGFVAAALLPLAIGFIGFLVLWVWVLAVSVTLLLRRTPAAT